MVAHKHFVDSKQAREFLVSRIVEESHRQHDALSDAQVKMLYFVDASPMSPDLSQVADRFADTATAQGYEAKIRRLSKQAYRYDRRNFPQDIPRWKEAIAILKWHDPDLTSMIELPRSLADVACLILTALLTIILGVCLVATTAWIEDRLPHQTRDRLVAASIALFVAGAGILKYTPLGKTLRERLGNFADRLIDRFH
jgi:hypothetical protein